MNGRTFVFFLAFVLAGCAAERAYDKGLELIQSGNVADGLGKMEQAHRLDPHSQLYRQAYFRHRDVALQREWPPPSWRASKANGMTPKLPTSGCCASIR